MRLFRLAQLLELKYSGLRIEAASIESIIGTVKKDIINAYNLYVNSDTAKDPVLQILADAGEPFSKALVTAMEKMVSNIDVLAATPHLLFRHLNKILGAIQAVKSDPDNKLRESIHSSLRGSKESERNYREHLKSKLEMILSRVSSILEKQAKILQKFLPKEVPLEGGRVEPERRELSKEKLLMFMKTPAAQAVGLDNMDVMSRLLSFPDLRQKITTVINAIDRGHRPADGPEVAAEAREIKKLFDERQQTNLPALEQQPEKPFNPLSLFEDSE